MSFFKPICVIHDSVTIVLNYNVVKSYMNSFVDVVPINKVYLLRSKDNGVSDNFISYLGLSMKYIWIVPSLEAKI